MVVLVAAAGTLRCRVTDLGRSVGNLRRRSLRIVKGHDGGLAVVIDLRIHNAVDIFHCLAHRERTGCAGHFLNRKRRSRLFGNGSSAKSGDCDQQQPPLVLLTLGVSGAWMSNLTALAPYQGYFISATLLFLGTGFWTVYIKPKKACEDGSYCASPQSDLVIKIVLWVATVLVAAALGVNLILPLFL